MGFKYESKGIQLGFSDSLLKNILKDRGIENVDRFLNLTEDLVESYDVFDNMLYAGSTFLKHFEKENNIIILEDFDFDGVSSTALLYSYLKSIYKLYNKEFKVEVIRHDYKTHGLTKEIMDKLKEMNFDLLFVPDAGSNDIKEHEELQGLGKDTIILDHHNFDKYSNYAIVVNNQLSSKTTNKSLTGVGMVYKFCKMLDDKLNINLADDYLDVFALGMIADVSDLRNLESRYLVLKGLELIQNGTNKNEFIKLLFKDKSYSMKKEVTISNVAFYMCPAVNAIIRGGSLEDREYLFKALSNEDGVVEYKGENISIAEYVVKLYGSLKRKQDKMVEKAVEELSKQVEEFNLMQYEIMIVNGSVVEDSTYNRIIVNRLADRYKKHCILLREKSDGKFLGSATGLRNKDIKDFRQWAKDTKLFELAEG